MLLLLTIGLMIFFSSFVFFRSTKHGNGPQRCGFFHIMADEDVFQVYTKTQAQQRKSKDYGKRAQAAKDALAERRKKKALKT